MLGSTASKLIFIAIALAAAIVTASAKLSALAALDVELVRSGEFWRLFTGHLAHITWHQYAADASLFVILYVSYGKSCGASATLSLALLSALSVSLAIVFLGNYQVYGGLSGINCAAFSALLMGLIIAHPYWPIPWLIATAFGAYLAIGDKGIVSGVPVAAEAHLAGALTGALFTLVLGALRKRHL